MPYLTCNAIKTCLDEIEFVKASISQQLPYMAFTFEHPKISNIYLVSISVKLLH